MSLLLKSFCFVFVILLSFPCASGAKQPLRQIEGLVTKVTDGDTINVQDLFGTKCRVRLYGIDAPEIEKVNKRSGRITRPGQLYGNQAKDALASKLHEQRVRLDIMDVDRYNRLVSLVWIGERNVNKEMVAEGWAWAYRRYLGRPYASEYITAEDKARAGRSGLWQQDNPVPPWEFRALIRK